eukprot:12441488-Alexandrium_andersonii.AAC.1
MQHQRRGAGPQAGYIQLPALVIEEAAELAPRISAHGPTRPAPEPRYRENLRPRDEDHEAALVLYSAYRTGARGHTGLSWGQWLRSAKDTVTPGSQPTAAPPPQDTRAPRTGEP